MATKEQKFQAELEIMEDAIAILQWINSHPLIIGPPTSVSGSTPLLVPSEVRYFKSLDYPASLSDSSKGALETGLMYQGPMDDRYIMAELNLIKVFNGQYKLLLYQAREEALQDVLKSSAKLLELSKETN